jgi:hypothetical protein
MFIVPNGVPEVVNSGEKQMQESSQTASFKFSWTGTSHRGVGLCCVLSEADTHAFALVFVSTIAAMLRHKVPNATIHLSWLVIHHHIFWALAIAYHRYAVYIYDIC